MVVALGSLGAQTSYEGQTVESINLVTSPHLDAERFRPLVAQEVEQPFSSQKIQATIDALQKTGEFGKVTLDVRPEPDGLKLTFTLEPAYYIGVLSFPGALKNFSYTRLLQVANFPDEDVYDKSRLPDSEAALVRFFQTNGFFQAEVHTEERLDDGNQLVNLVFNVQLGKRASIGGLQINGPSSDEQLRLRAALRSLRARLSGSLLTPGKPYTTDRLKAATRLLQRTLSKETHLASAVKMNAPKFDPETNRADISFDIKVGPTVTVKTTGARVSILPFVAGREMKKLIPIYDEGTIDRDLVLEGQRNLENYFQEKGYFDAKVQTDFKRGDDTISLLYKIDKGKRHKVEAVTFRGNRHVGEDELSPIVTVHAHRFFFSKGRFSQKLVRSSADNITAKFRDLGFEQVKVEPEVVDREPNVTVIFHITEGPQTTVESWNIDGNQKVFTTDLKPTQGFELRRGAPFSTRKLASDRSHMLAVYLNRGFLNATIKTDVQRNSSDPQKVSVVYTITENQQVRISRVIFLGQKKTRISFMQRASDIKPETPLSQGDLLKTESQLYDLGIFDWASVGPRRPIASQTDEEALVKVHEAKRNTITYGFGLEISHRGGNIPSGTVALPGLPPVGTGNNIVTSEQRFTSPRGSIEFTRRNLRGYGETGSISLLVSRLDQRAVATYTDPQFRRTQWKSLFSASIERTTLNPLYAARLGGAPFQLERTLDKAKTTTFQVRYSFQRTVLSELVFPQLVLPGDRSVRLSTFSGTLIRDTRDKPLDAKRGIYRTIDIGVTPKALGASANFARLLGQYAFYRPVGKIVWANSIRVGLEKPFGGSDVPTSERFFSGGGTSLRGFPINSAGPQRDVTVCGNPADSTTCADIRVPVGGNQLFIVNSELRFPIPIYKNLGGVVFYDGGNVYNKINFNDFVNHYSNTIGIGVRYDTPVGPVRLDLGRNLNPVAGINATQYFITLGQAF